MSDRYGASYSTEPNRSVARFARALALLFRHEYHAILASQTKLGSPPGSIHARSQKLPVPRGLGKPVPPSGSSSVHGTPASRCFVAMFADKSLGAHHRPLLGRWRPTLVRPYIAAFPDLSGPCTMPPTTYNAAALVFWGFLVPLPHTAL
ncbi:hypothetical protein PsYK624_015520 [Phanerochaete sordida]|uniref:Uncharacterized protein n=1 Tax=Phanerochaete sordida TaxID=48140 RepID=A0A9P3FYC0_9APHY|nr:hypothetical protein PsYK624_015520 [Phanerochaete sordida]